MHSRPKLPSDWVLGQPVNFDVLMNIHSIGDGTLIRADMQLADLPVGQDESGVFIVDYGDAGRLGSAAEISLSRIHIR